MIHKYSRFIKEIITLVGESKKKLPWFIILFLLSSVLDLASIGLIAPYVALIIDPEFFSKGEAYLILTTIGAPKDHKDLIIFISTALVIVFLFKTIAGILIQKSILDFSFQQEVNLRSLLMKSYQSLDYSDYLRRNSAEYIHTIQTLTRQFANMLQLILRLFSEVLVGIVIFAMLAWRDVNALGLLVVLLLGVMITYDFIFRSRLLKYGQLSNKFSTKMIQGINEGIKGMKEVRILGNQDYFYNIVHNNAKQYAEVELSNSLISSAPRFILELVLIVFVVVLVIVSLMSGQDMNALLPTLSMFGVAAMRLTPAANLMVSGFAQIRYNRHGIHMLYSDFLKLDSIWNDNEIMSSKEEAKNEIFEQVELKNLQYSYPGSSHKVISDITLTISSGESIGFIGSSGSGKTTLIDLMLGLLQPNSGSIMFNGKNIKSDLVSWQKKVAYLPQQVFLIDDTLRSNIALGLDNSEIDDVKIESAIYHSRLTELVSQLVSGVDTLIGENGTRLSGGQRQRVALARAFYFNRDVLIMDESTSSLDSKTEEEIVSEIQALKGKKTIIVIAHRLTTLQNCDVIYRIDKGKIVEKGDYNQIVLNDRKA